jgi:hypothetical protein
MNTSGQNFSAPHGPTAAPDLAKLGATSAGRPARCLGGQPDMSELIRAATGFPTAVYTVLLGLAVVYWLFVILGALDLDLGEFDVDAAEPGDADAGKGMLGVLSAFGLGRVPFTVAATAVLLVAWTTCLLTMHYAGQVITGAALTWGIGPAVALLALLVALVIAGFLVRPLIPLFHTHTARSRVDYIGSVCDVSTGRVDHEFGQATIEDGGTVLVIPVRCDHHSEHLTRGSRALIIDYDNAREAYVVEPYEPIVADKPDSN